MITPRQPRIPKYLSPALKCSHHVHHSPLYLRPDNEETYKPLRDKMYEGSARNGTSQEALSFFRNSLGTPGETQGILRRNLTLQTRSLHSVDQALSVDLQCRPARQPAWLRWTHRKVGRALGEREGHFQHYLRPEAEARVWLPLPLCSDFAFSAGTPPSALPCFQ